MREGAGTARASPDETGVLSLPIGVSRAVRLRSQGFQEPSGKPPVQQEEQAHIQRRARHGHPDHHGSLGRQPHQFSLQDKEAVAAAERRFRQLTGQGFIAAVRTGPGQSRRSHL